MNLNRRTYLKLFALSTFIGSFSIAKKLYDTNSILDDEYVVANGWVMLKKDLKG